MFKIRLTFLIQQQAECELSIAAFCRKEGINSGAFYAARSRYKSDLEAGKESKVQNTTEKEIHEAGEEPAEPEAAAAHLETKELETKEILFGEMDPFEDTDVSAFLIDFGFSSEIHPKKLSVWEFPLLFRLKIADVRPIYSLKGGGTYD